MVIDVGIPRKLVSTASLCLHATVFMLDRSAVAEIAHFEGGSRGTQI